MPRLHRVALAGALAVTALLLAGCSKLVPQTPANNEAASIADGYLARKIDARLAGLETQDDFARAARVQSWLDESNPDGIGPFPLTWVTVGPRVGPIFPVVVHYRWGETTLSDAAWGLACRDYVVGDRVQVFAKTCPDGTPEAPFSPELLED